MAQKKSKQIKIIQIILLTLVVVSLASIGVYMHQKNAQIAKQEALKQQALTRVEEVVDEEAEVIDWGIDFDALHEMDENVYAWIQIPDTNVDYPIAQSGKDDVEDKYLHFNLDGTYGYPGTIYTQKRNAKDFNDPDTVIYGHAMYDGRMFRDTLQYKDQSFFDNHRTIYVYTEDGKRITYRVFASMMWPNELILHEYNDFKSLDVFEEYLQEVMDVHDLQSIVDRDVKLDRNDKIITLSTCPADLNYRFLTLAYKEKVEPEDK